MQYVRPLVMLVLVLVLLLLIGEEASIRLDAGWALGRHADRGYDSDKFTAVGVQYFYDSMGSSLWFRHP